MNFKTTIFLMAALAAGVVGLYYVTTQERIKEFKESVEPKKPEPPPGVKKLLSEELGDIRRIVIQRHGEQPWTFEKKPPKEGDPPSKWMLTAPATFTANAGELNGLTNKIKDLQYEIAYRPGEAGVTAESTGLEPAQATISLTDEKDRTVELEVGKPASDMTTYVRRKGSPEIIVGKTSPKTLLKTKLAEYRDTLLWTFRPDEATRLEIVERTDPASENRYVLNRVEGKWVFESPVSARTTTRVDDMIRKLSVLRVTQWLGDYADQLAGYGFSPAAWTIRATVVEKIPVSKDAAEKPAEGEGESEAPKFETKESTYVVELSDVSPIGDEAKAYVRVGGETMIASMMKATVDRLKPVMSEWRDMRLTTASVLAASRVEIKNADGRITLVKKDGGWTVEDDGSRADEPSVNELLKAISELKAVAFTDGETIDESKFGLVNPRAEIRLTVPGADEPERIVVGGPTDAATNLLHYVRRGDSSSVAKVRLADLAALTRGPLVYRDRTVLNLAAGTIERIDLSVTNPVAEGRMEVSLARSEGEWSMVAPIAAPVREEAVAKLADSLIQLKAVAVADDRGRLAEYGLDQPEATLRLSYRPPVEYRTETVRDPDNPDAEPTTRSIEHQPPNQSLELSLARHDGLCFARRDQGNTVYELNADVCGQVFAEFRAGSVFAFDDAKVVEFAIRDGNLTHAFAKHDGRWRYKVEPDLPLDTKKIQNLLLQLKDLRSERFVIHTGASLTSLGLDIPAKEVTVTLDGGDTRRLMVSGQVCDKDPARSHYAAATGVDGVFLLTPDAIARFAVSLESLE